MAELNETSVFRVRILAVATIVVLGVLLARLWLLQGVWGPAYKKQAEENRIRQIAVDSPRGLILDRNGEPLVKNRLAVTVTLQPDKANDKGIIKRLARTLDIKVAEIERQLRNVKTSPIEPRKVMRDISPEKIAYIEEHGEELDGVELKVEPIRDYPFGKLGAHVVGYIGEISELEAKSDEFQGYDLGDLVGKSGVERQYENLLSGNKGTEFVEVNAAGRVVKLVERKEPDPGNNVVLTIDKNIQASAEEALSQAIAGAKKTKYPKASAGAAVVMTPTGEVLAMASHPTYEPNAFIGGISTAQWSALTDKKSEDPLSNRAIMAGYPPGSTFKIVTAIAGLKTGVMTAGTTIVCRGRWTGLGAKWAKWCWNRAGHGPQNLEGALRQSNDSFFYDIGYRLHRRGNEDLQLWARQLGFGSKTGIDMPSEAEGRVPTAAWKKAWNKKWPQNQAWFPGDTVNMSIGQGDILVTPLQIAGAYAAIANGGTLYRPHVAKSVIALDGRKIYDVPDEKIRDIDLSEAHLAAVRQGLRRVIVDGTGAAAFARFPIKVSGKTSTAEVIGKDDFAGFAAYAPSDDPKYIVSVVIEQGGHGGSAAAPMARKIIGDIYGLNEKLLIVRDDSR